MLCFVIRKKRLTFLGDLSVHDKINLILYTLSISLFSPSLSGITLPSWNELSWICNSHEVAPFPATQSRTVANRAVIYQKLSLWARCLATPGFDLGAFLFHTDKAVYRWDECTVWTQKMSDLWIIICQLQWHFRLINQHFVFRCWRLTYSDMFRRLWALWLVGNLYRQGNLKTLPNMHFRFDDHQSPVNHLQHKTCIMKRKQNPFWPQLIRVNSWCIQMNFIRETCSIW